MITNHEIVFLKLNDSHCDFIRKEA